MDPAGLIPDGPLHPQHAVFALIVGLVLGGFGGRRSIAVPLGVAAGAVTLAVRQPGLVPEGFVDQPSPAGAIGLVSVVALVMAGVGWISIAGSATAWIAASVAGSAAVWATAPDTEPALIGGAVLLAMAPTLGPAAGRWAPVALVVPVAAAVVGTVGRPDRLPLVLACAAGAVSMVLVAGCVLGRWRRIRQRAGTPTTVAPAGTSVVTTAPAPTTAS